MTWREEKIDKEHFDLVWSGAEQGIAPSPLKGIANLQNVNISTEIGEVMCSFSRALSTTPVITNGSMAVTNGNQNLVYGPATINVGTWITVSSGVGNITSGTYFLAQNGGGSSNYNIYTGFFTGQITPNASGTLIFSTINMGAPVANPQVEKYTSALNGTQYRYYVLDQTGLLWIYDTDTGVAYGNAWILQDVATTLSAIGVPNGLGLINGWLFAFVVNGIFVKPTCALSTTWVSFVEPTNTMSSENHFSYTGHQGEMYYCDNNFIASVFPNTSLITGGANIQSYASYTASSTTGTIATLIGGSIPTLLIGTLRIPAVFFAAVGGTIPSALTVGTIYYIVYNISISNFQVFAAASGGSALNLSSGASGTQYFNTFYPASAGGEATFTSTPQRLNLPFFETAKSIIEIGDIIIVGGRTNTLYPWNQIDPTPGDLIQLPENDVHYMIGVNNMGYVFAGHKGNIYITNGSTASAVISVPDYCAGIDGSPSTYIEPYFSWGGADYIRGRVYFSIQDQTGAKAGNCGGIWSFVPTQNFFFGQDVGLSLRMENTNSYGNLNGLANIIIGNQVQTAIGVQYFSAWSSDQNPASATYGIDASGTKPVATAIIETDALQTGTMLNKRSFAQQEYKLSSPLLSGESVQLYYRLNLTDAWTSCGTVVAEPNSLSGYFTSVFQNTQWLQLQAQLIPNGTSTFSMNRLTELRLR